MSTDAAEAQAGPPVTGLWGAAAIGGARAAARALHDAVVSDRLAHAWLLVGPDGVGQRSLSVALAATLNCAEQDPTARPCGGCDPCRRTAREIHPALVAFEPDGAAHRVEDVRGAWSEASSRTTPEARRKVLRIVAADRMNVAAQNAFLKMLEEPPASVVWILEAEEPGRLLETILSRCRRVDIPPWSSADVRGFVTGRLGRSVGGDGAAADDGLRIEAAVCAARSSGEWLRGLLRDLADVGPREARETLDALVTQRRTHLSVVAGLAEGGPGAVVPTARNITATAKARRERLAERHAEELAGLEEAYGVEGPRGWPPGVKARVEKRFERIERAEEQSTLRLLLDDLASYLRDLVAVSAGGDRTTLVNSDHGSELARDVGLLRTEDLLEAIGAVGRCRSALDRNGAPELHLERLLLSIATSIYVRSVA